MKTLCQLLEENYTPFKKIAFGVLRGHIPFSDFPPIDCQDLAHRIVVEFFVSDSLNYTYDETIGNLEGYFVSYSRLRIRSLRREHHKQSQVSSLESWMSGIPALDFSESSYDVYAYYKALLGLLGKKSFRTIKGCIPYSFILHVAIMQSFQENCVTYAHLARTLKINKHLARSMYKKLWEFTHGKRTEGLL